MRIVQQPDLKTQAQHAITPKEHRQHNPRRSGHVLCLHLKKPLCAFLNPEKTLIDSFRSQFQIDGGVA